MPVPKTAQCPLFTSFKEFASRLEILYISKYIGIELLIRLVITKKCKADTFQVLIDRELYASHLGCVLYLTVVLIKHVSPAPNKNM